MSFKTVHVYKLDVMPFGRLLDVNKAAKNGDALALDFMENRRKEYFSKAEARKTVKKYSKADFYRLISVVEV